METQGTSGLRQSNPSYIHGEETPADGCHDQKNPAGEQPTSTNGTTYNATRIEVIQRRVDVTTGVMFDGEGSVNFGQTQSMDPDVALAMLANLGCTVTKQDKEAFITPITVTLPGTTGYIRAVAETVADARATEVTGP